MMGRFCKTCRYLAADKERRHAKCTFWKEFEKTFPMPWASARDCLSPRFYDLLLSPRHIWDDLPRAKELDGIDTSCVDGPWSELMDCPQWQP